MSQENGKNLTETTKQQIYSKLKLKMESLMCAYFNPCVENLPKKLHAWQQTMASLTRSVFFYFNAARKIKWSASKAICVSLIRFMVQDRQVKEVCIVKIGIVRGNVEAFVVPKPRMFYGFVVSFSPNCISNILRGSLNRRFDWFQYRLDT